MAEALWEQEGQGDWEAASAGSNPAGYVHPLAIRVMGEVGIDIAANESKHADGFKDEPFDVVITVCDGAKESCPAFPSAKRMLHWPFEDPARAEGSVEQKLAVFRNVRDQIRARIKQYLAQSENASWKRGLAP
jgi:arsenate reductase